MARNAVPRLSGLHRAAALIGRLLAAPDAAERTRHDAKKLIKLVAVSVVIVPPFALYYLVLGLTEIGMALAVTGVVMVASLFAFRATASLQVARDLFLASFFCFLCFATHRFGTLISPASFWFTAIPVISVLLSGGRSGLAWLAIVLAGMGVLFGLSESRWAIHGALQWPEHFFAASLGSMVAAIFLFVLMVDGARRKTMAQLRQANEAIEELARRDSLTGLYNRRHVWEALQAEEDRAKAARTGFSILVVDLDRFKSINDAFGHITGDIVLKDVSKLIEGGIGDADLCGRYGGEEFLILLRSADEPEARATAEAIRHRIAAIDFRHIDGPARVTVSIGLAEYRQGETFGDTFKRADQALYAAKAAGRNCVVPAPPVLRITKAA